MTILHSNLTITDAISNERIFKPWFRNAESWGAWRSFLCALFALPMSETELQTFTQCTGRLTPPSRQAREAFLIVGRRGGKSLSLAAIAVFVACFGDFKKHVVPGESLRIPILAADRHQARVILGYVESMLSEIPMLRKMLVNKVADTFELSNGVSIAIQTASFRGARGFSAPLVLCDELAFWYSEDSGSSNPDTEILRALRPSMASLPNAMLIAASSPYSKKGALYEAHRKHYGQDDSDTLVWQASSKTMNPSLPQSVIDEAYASDPEAASAEFGGLFRSDISGFVDRNVIEACIDKGVYERPYDKRNKYSAFCDPSGGSSDSFSLAIAHMESESVVIDCLREWKAPFSPPAIVAELAGVLRSYNLSRVTGDKYAAMWVVEAFRSVGIGYEHSTLTRSECYLNLLPSLNSRKISLLDNQRSVNQLANLERRTARSGKDSIDHPPGGHDDLANSLAGAAAHLSESMRAGSGSLNLYEVFAAGRQNAQIQFDENDERLAHKAAMAAAERFYY
jgi:hypothetical protein